MKRTIRTRVAACGGELIAWYRESGKSGAAYYAGQAPRSGSGIQVSYLRDGEETPIDSIERMIAEIRSHGCSPGAECATNPLGFAILCGFLLRLGGRIIECAEFWNFLDDRYGVAARELTPRMEGSRLRYTVGCVAPNGPMSHLIKVSVDFETSTIQQSRQELKAA